MASYGFAAFLKLASLNPKPQKTAIRNRLNGLSGQPYDFHRSLKLAAKKFVVGSAAMAELITAAEDVTQLPERKSLIRGLEKLGLWRDGCTGVATNVPPRVYESPRGLFKVSSQPEFGVEEAGRVTAFHLWNTKTPDLTAEAAYGTLALLPELYADLRHAPVDYGVLSLHEPQVFRLSEDAEADEKARRLIFRLEEVFLQVHDELSLPVPPKREDRPGA